MVSKRKIKKLTPLNVAGIVLFAIVFVGIIFVFSKENKKTIMLEEKYDKAIIETSLGNIEIKFLDGKATTTIRNFLKLAEDGFYDDTKIHRVTKDFIQGGDPLTKGDDKSVYGTGDPGYFIPDEINDEKFLKGIVAMANKGKPDTGGSQFFIQVASQAPWLTGKHTVFAKVISGMDIVQKIRDVKTGENDIPIKAVVLEKVILK